MLREEAESYGMADSNLGLSVIAESHNLLASVFISDVV